MPRIPTRRDLAKLSGTAARRQTTSPPEVADDLAGFVLEDRHGEPVRLGDLWADGPAVLVWLRHYGWIFCRAHAVQLHRDRDGFDEAGAQLVTIGQGTPAHAQRFVEEYGLEGLEVLVDPKRETYRAAGAKIATLDELFHPRVVAKAAAITATERLIQGRTRGHPSQLGGVLVVAPGGEIAWAHMANDAGDNPPNHEVLKAVRRAADAA